MCTDRTPYSDGFLSGAAVAVRPSDGCVFADGKDVWGMLGAVGEGTTLTFTVLRKEKQCIVEVSEHAVRIVGLLL